MKIKLTLSLSVLFIIVLVLLTSCDKQDEISPSVQSNNNVIPTTEHDVKSNETDASTDISTSVIQHIVFSDMISSNIDRIIMISGSTGEKVELKAPETIAPILEVVKCIEGINPISSRGYYGFTYRIELFSNETEILTFSVCPTELGGIIYYGLYESVGAHNYPGRYELTNCTYERIDEILKNYFNQT